jgi:hypothetical protein
MIFEPYPNILRRLACIYDHSSTGTGSSWVPSQFIL